MANLWRSSALGSDSESDTNVEPLTNEELADYNRAVRDIYRLNLHDTTSTSSGDSGSGTPIGSDVPTTEPVTATVDSLLPSVKSPSTDTLNSHQIKRLAAGAWSAPSSPRESSSQDTNTPESTSNAVQNRVHTELVKISRLLHERNVALTKREAAISAREAELKQAQAEHSTTVAAIEARVQAELERRFATESPQQVVALNKQLDKARKEIRRLRAAYDEQRSTSVQLREQLAVADAARETLMVQFETARRRITTLKQARGIRERYISQTEFTKSQNDGGGSAGFEPDITQATTEVQAQAGVVTQAGTKHSTTLPAAIDVLTMTLEWLNSIGLDTLNSLEDKDTVVAVQCGRVLPSLCELLRTPKLELPCLRLTQWCILMLNKSEIRNTLKTTYRRIGSWALDSLKTNGKSTSGSERDGAHRTLDLNGRMLTALLVLGTLSQADQVAQALDILRCDIMCEDGQEIFYKCRGLDILLPLVSARPHLSRIADILLAVTTDSALAPGFLLELCVAEWFSVLFLSFGGPPGQRQSRESTDLDLIEKLAVVLQKLSKIGKSRVYFAKHGAGTMIREMLERYGADRPFLALNLRSIIVNLQSI